MYNFFTLFPRVLGILLLSLPFNAAAVPPAPELVCPEHEFFFGSVSNTETIRHEFVLANEGAAPLYISTVRTDCGCVLASARKNKLAPGESTALKVSFDLKGRSGPQMRRITVISNDPFQPRLLLCLIGETAAPLEIEPDRLYWGNIRAAAPAEKSCEIKFGEGEESYITALTVPTNIFAAEALTIKPRRHYKIIVRAVPPLPVCSLQTNLLITTDHPRFKTIAVPMQARITGDLYAIPEEITVAAAGREAVNRVFLVYSALKTKFKIIKVELPRPEMQAEIRPMAAANGWRIDLHNIQPAESLANEKIIIITDCETMPLLTVPIRVTHADNTSGDLKIQSRPNQAGAAQNLLSSRTLFRTEAQ